MFTAQEVAEAVLEDRRQQTANRKKWEERESAARKRRKSESKMSGIASLRRQIATLSIKHSSSKIEAQLARNKVTYQESLRRSRTYARSSYSYRHYNSSTGRYYTSSYRPRYRIISTGSKSVPGSLETWEQRAIRYERATAGYAAKLANLRSRLASIDPSYVPVPSAGSSVK